MKYINLLVLVQYLTNRQVPTMITTAMTTTDITPIRMTWALSFGLKTLHLSIKKAKKNGKYLACLIDDKITHFQSK